VRECYKKCTIFNIDKCYSSFELRWQKLDKLPIAFMLLEKFKLRSVCKMRQNRRDFFHKVIIASICCIVLAGCGHKTAPVYVADSSSKIEQR